ncbi:MAG: cadmium-translocating P-type ATPase [Gammaproteobacteria bacterium]|nr:MAG: cadmium-translocating P-type ATPase [Gammaproteobacteria bacterium]
MTPSTESPPADAAQLCYHCGEQVPAGVTLAIDIGGQPRPMCCPGCRAVAGLISANGLDNFYQQRTAFNERPQQQDSTTLEQYLIYDDPELAAGFTVVDDTGMRSASLLLGGITCAACTWLIEQSMSRLPGVDRALVNLQQSRLDIHFDPVKLPLSEIFARVEQLGYRPRPFQTSTARLQMAQEYRTELRRLAVAGLGMMQVGMFAIALHAGDIQGIDVRYQGLLRWVSLLVASFIVVYSARPFFSTAWRHLKVGALVMDLPVALAIGLAWLASAWATISGTGQVYFDSVVMFTFFLLLGRFLEHRVRQRHALTWFDAESTLPGVVATRRDGQWVTAPRTQLHGGETVLVKAGETVPVDAQIVDGSSAVQEDTFNGEHLPREVRAGDTIYAGTVNVEGALQAKVLGSYRESRLAALQRSVEVAQTEKPRLAKLADRIASWFVAGILLVTMLTAVVWNQLAPEQAFWVTLSVLVISCPCALALATPAALTSAASALRASGVIVRGENALDSLSRTTHLLFDKTGTLTEGSLTIADVRPLGDMSAEDLLAMGGALQHYSSHPVARAFAGITGTGRFEDVDYRVGAGLEARQDGGTYRMGSEQFCRQLAADLPKAPDDPLYWIALCREGSPLAWIGLNDRTRIEAADVIASAQRAGLQVELLSGDSSAQGPLLARSLGISTVNHGLTPQQKMAHVRQLQAEGAVVAMVGDGLNDAPVLSLADASFAVTGATDLARTQADFVIVGGDLHAVTDTWRKARQCRRIIGQNFAWALGYNICAIPLAAMGYIPPWAAAIGMSLSSLLVVANSLRLNRKSSPSQGHIGRG